MNLLTGRLLRPAGGGAVLLEDGTTIPLPLAPPLAEGEAVTLGVRPEAVNVSAAGPLPGRVTVVEHLGGETLTHVKIAGNRLVTVKTAETAPAGVGEAVRLAFDPARLHLFGPDGRAVPLQSPAASGAAIPLRTRKHD